MNGRSDGPREPSFAEKALAMAFGTIFLLIFALFAVSGATQAINPSRFTIIREILAVGGAAFAAIIPGFLSVSAKTTRGVVLRAGGAIAVLLILLFSPAQEDRDLKALGALADGIDIDIANLEAAVVARDFTRAGEQLRRMKDNTSLLRNGLSEKAKSSVLLERAQ